MRKNIVKTNISFVVHLLWGLVVDWVEFRSFIHSAIVCCCCSCIFVCLLVCCWAVVADVLVFVVFYSLCVLFYYKRLIRQINLFSIHSFERNRGTDRDRQTRENTLLQKVKDLSTSRHFLQICPWWQIQQHSRIQIIVAKKQKEESNTN